MKSINMIGPVTKRTGYGIHFLNLSLALNKKLKVSVTARSQVDPELTRDMEVQKLVNEHPFNYSVPTICVWHAECMQLFTGSKRIGFPVFETNMLSSSECYQLKNLDAIFLTSSWAKDVVISSMHKHGFKVGSLPICVVGEGYDPTLFQPRVIVENYMTLGWKRPYIQNVGKWEVRKGHPMLIKVLGQLADEDLRFTFVGFWGSIFQADWRQQANQYLIQAGFIQVKPGQYEKRDVIVILSERLDNHIDLANVMSMCDFGVYPHKAEGWGLPIIETMGCGRPVIATNYSGPSEYLTHDVGFMLEPVGFESMYDPHFFKYKEQGQWAIINEHALEGAMRIMITMEDSERKAVGVKALERALEFTWDASADRVIKFLSDEGIYNEK